MENIYYILGVNQNATLAEIKAAYKALALQYHPDKNPGENTEETFKRVNHAYQILSDPEKRAQYDLILTYSSYSETVSTTSFESTTYDYSSVKKKKSTTPKRDVAKEQKIGIVLSFVFLFIIGSMALGFTLVTDYMEEQQREENRKKKIKLLGKSFVHYNNLAFRNALEEVNLLISEKPNNKVLANFKIEIIERVHSLAKKSIDFHAYDDALKYLLILKDFENNDDNEIFYNIARLYKRTDQYDKAIDILERIVDRDTKDIVAYAELADINNFKLANYDKALEYYNIASDLAIQFYTNKYGKAYPLLVQPAFVPNIHFNIFYGKANAEVQKGNYEMALSNCKWACFLNQSKAEAFYFKGVCQLKLRNKSQACKSWQIATQKGSSEAAQMLIDYCQ